MQSLLLCPTPVQRKPIFLFQKQSRAEIKRKAGRRSITPLSPHTFAEGTEEQALAGMYKVNSDCWVWSPRPPLCLLPQHSGSHASAMLSHREEEVEDEVAGEHTVCCCTTGCDDVISQAADAQWSTFEPPVYSRIPGSSGLSEHNPCAPSSQQSITVTETDVLPHYIGGHGWEGAEMETQGCAYVYGQREPESLGPCWPGTPFICHGVRRSMVVGVEVVEEVAVEDTLEVITEDIYTDDLLEPETLQDDQMYPT